MLTKEINTLCHKSGRDTCGGYPCFFFAAMDAASAGMLYGPGAACYAEKMQDRPLCV
jgi:hypothetical protein